ncbi:hypothetical protein AYO48_03360 [Gaiella sp. SCGC AG-212-M14]|nr:hypothetical protein AYO48_03360 [Gaiella sp. SCGC AG-212-M14]
MSALARSPIVEAIDAVDADMFLRAEEAFARVSDVLLREDFTGWDPYDALASPLVRAVARSRRTRTVAVQALRRLPFNPRALLAVPRIQHVKGLALGVSAYSRAADSLSDFQYANEAEKLAEVVLGRALERPSGLAWGYEFDVQTRWAYYQRGEPNAIVTSFAANALLDAAALTGRSDFAEAAASAASFAMDELLVTGPGGAFFAYVPRSTVLIHNANVLVAALVARVDRSSELALDAAWTTVRRQHATGAWPYGERAGLEWVDGFHTAYVLGALQRWVAVGVSDFEQPVSRGLAFYIERLIDRDGTPRATPHRRTPVDIHAASSAVATLSRLHKVDDRAVETAVRVLRWTLDNLRRSDGRFMFRKYRAGRNSIPYVRWSDAHMLVALAEFVGLRGRNG